ESHQSLAKHKKLLRLAGLLRTDRITLIGHLHLLWWWGLDNADIDGNLGDVTSYEISEAAEWKGDPDEFVSALEQAGFLERYNDHFVLHDWYDYAGKLNEARAKERERSRRRRAEQKEQTAEQPPVDRRSAAGQPTVDRRSTTGQPPVDQQTTVGTQPNLTIPKDDDDNARAREEERWSEFRQVFVEAYGGLPNSAHYEEIDGFLADGRSLDAVIEAGRRAALNKAKGWSYVRRILQNWLKDGLLTVEQIREHEEKRQTRTRASPPSPSQDGLPSWIDQELEKYRRIVEEQRRAKEAETA